MSTSATDRPTVWTSLAYAYALLLAAVLSYFLLGIPVQLTDSFGNLLNVQGRTLGEVVADNLWQASFLRPLLWGQIAFVYGLVREQPFDWFRGLHALQVVLLSLMFVALARPRTRRDLACVPLGLTVLVGLHTFAGTVEEAFPINTFLTIVLCCYAAALVALADYRWWHDALAAVLFVFAALTVESGLLVCVIVAGAFVLGARGVSRAGIALQVVLLAAYFVLRYGALHVGSPSLGERSSGFGFGMLEPSQMQARFGAGPWLFYLYNVATSALSVLASEPRAGVWRLVRGVVDGPLEPAMVVNVAASIGATGLLAWFAWSRRAAWRARTLTRDDRIVLLFGGVLAANALMSYAYTKDVIMSPAGAFYALAVYAAARHAAAAVPWRAAHLNVLAVTAAAVASGAWAVREAGACANLRQAALTVRNEWAYADEGLGEQHIDVSGPGAAALKMQLSDDAIWRHPAPPPLLPNADWVAVFDVK